MELGYARVSTTKQDLDRQIDALTGSGIAAAHIYVDKKSGATVDRPGLNALLDYARDGDVIVVHTLDRLGRTVREVLNLIHQLRERGIGVRNLADPIHVDSARPDDPMAQLAVVLLALFAQMERTYTLERAAHARAVATAKGRRVGRPSVVTQSQLVHAIQLRDGGHTIAEITAATGLTRSTLYRHLPARGPEPVTAAPATTREATRRLPDVPGRLTCPSCGHQPASRAEISILWLHLDDGHIVEAHHCAMCQPHEHVVDVGCADCGDGPLITGQPPDLGDRPVGTTLDWLREHGWETHPDLLCPTHTRLRLVTASLPTGRVLRRPLTELASPRPRRCWSWAWTGLRDPRELWGYFYRRGIRAHRECWGGPGRGPRSITGSSAAPWSRAAAGSPAPVQLARNSRTRRVLG